MWILILASGFALLLSIVSRVVVESLLVERISILGSFIGLEHVRNSGIAFGIPIPQYVLVFLLPCILVLLLQMAWKQRRQPVHSVGFGLIFGGAIANVIDRLVDGVVTDFIQIGIWPVFNVADSCITVGVGILLIGGMMESRREM